MMRPVLAVTVLLLASATAGLGAQQPVPAYGDEALARYRDVYHGPLQDNLRSVLLPALNPAELVAVHGVRLELVLTHPHDPLAYEARARPPVIRISVRSLKFLDDLALTSELITHRGLGHDLLTDYLAFLKYGATGRTRPDPLTALGLPGSDRAPAQVDDRAKRLFSAAAIFVLAHELGHVRLHHPPPDDRPVGDIQHDELQADSFAIELFRRMSVPPLGVVLFFQAATILGPNRADFPTSAAWEGYLLGSHHPATPVRLRGVASALRDDPCAFSRLISECRQGAMQLAAIASQLETYAGLLEDPGLQQVIALRGASINPVQLRNAAAGAPAAEAGGTASIFQGEYSGHIHLGELVAVNVAIACEGLWCLGRFDSGFGEGTLTGWIEGTRLRFRWTMDGRDGTGVFTPAAPDEIRGSWGYGESVEGLGTWSLRRNH